MYNFSKSLSAVFVLIPGLFIFSNILPAQPNFTIPRSSPHASVSQTIGITEINIDFHRPGVKGRTIWGGLQKYGEVWRAGANENTTISFSHDVKIEGKDLAAGKYGLHMIPGKNDWTVIFSKINTAWGSFSYDEKNDALRVGVKPVAAPMRERLIYFFDNLTDNSARVVLHWEKIQIPFTIEVDVDNITIANIRAELHGLPRFSWQGWQQAANYCWQQNLNHDEALQWIDRSISMNENFVNLQTKSALLAQTGNKKESEQIMKKAMSVATESELNTYGYQLMGRNEMNEAIRIFKLNIEKHPDSWNCYDSLGEAYNNNGDKEQAKKYYSKALSICIVENQKKRIIGILENL